MKLGADAPKTWSDLCISIRFFHILHLIGLRCKLRIICSRLPKRFQTTNEARKSIEKQNIVVSPLGKPPNTNFWFPGIRCKMWKNLNRDATKSEHQLRMFSEKPSNSTNEAVKLHLNFSKSRYNFSCFMSIFDCRYENNSWESSKRIFSV